MWRDRFAALPARLCKKKKTEGGQSRHNLSPMCHISKQTTFQVKIMKKPPSPPPQTHTHTHTHTHTLSYTVHQLSSSCHGCRQPGSGVYSQSIQNGPCHFYWISHQQKGQLRWWVLVGGQSKTTVPTRQTAPSRALPCPLCGLARVGCVQQRSCCSLAVERRVRSPAQVVSRSYWRSRVLCDKEILVSFLWGDDSVVCGVASNWNSS